MIVKKYSSEMLTMLIHFGFIALFAINDVRPFRRITCFEFIRAVSIAVGMLDFIFINFSVVCRAGTLAFRAAPFRRIHEFETLKKPAVVAEPRQRQSDAPIKLELHLDNPICPGARRAFDNLFEN